MAFRILRHSPALGGLTLFPGGTDNNIVGGEHEILQNVRNARNCGLATLGAGLVGSAVAWRQIQRVKLLRSFGPSKSLNFNSRLRSYTVKQTAAAVLAAGISGASFYASGKIFYPKFVKFDHELKNYRSKKLQESALTLAPALAGIRLDD